MVRALTVLAAVLVLSLLAFAGSAHATTYICIPDVDAPAPFVGTFGAIEYKSDGKGGPNCKSAIIPAVRGFIGCKMRKTVTGRCTKKVNGFRCKEQRSGDDKVIKGKVRCTRKRFTFTFSYTQYVVPKGTKEESCTPPPYPAGAPSGTFETVKTFGPTCEEANEFVLAYAACRLANGPTGRCVKKVDGFACRESRLNQGPAFEAEVFCKGPGGRIDHTYTQSTS